MYICICYGITDTEIKQAIENGHNSREKLAEKISVGTCCGRCGEELDRLLLENQTPIAAPVIYPQKMRYSKQPAA